MIITKPALYTPEHYFNTYISKAPKEDLIMSLKHSRDTLLDYITKVPVSAETHAYASGKWTIKQVLQHINDTERIMAYRALRMARKDITAMPGFDENWYADNDYSNNLSLAAITHEFKSIRSATIAFFKNIDESVLDFEAIASDLKITPRVMGWMISGHSEHHLQVLLDRYGFE